VITKQELDSVSIYKQNNVSVITLKIPTYHSYVNHLWRGSAKQSVKDSLGSLWQHGNFNTSQFRYFPSYNDETLHV